MSTNHITNKTLVTSHFQGEITKGTLSDIFYDFTGSTNAIVRLFSAKTISKDNIGELYQQFLTKATQYEIEGFTSKANLKLKNETIYQMNSIEDFFQKPFPLNKESEFLTLQWNFLLAIPRREKPITITIAVRISGSPDFSQFLHLLASQDPLDIDELESEMRPIHCRIEYQDELIGQEFMELFTSWFNALPSSIYASTILIKARKHIGLCTFVIKYVPQLLTIFALCLGLFSRPFKNYESTIGSMSGIFKLFFIYFIVSLLIYKLVSYVSNFLALLFQKSISNYGKTSLLLITNGDTAAEGILAQKNRDQSINVLVGFFSSIGLDIISGIISGILLNNIFR